MKFCRHQIIKDICGVLILALVSIGLGIYDQGGGDRSSVNVAALPYPTFSLAEFRVFVDARHVLILDARSKKEYQQGHVPGALSLSIADFDVEYPKLEAKLSPEKNRLLIVYCVNTWCGLGDDLQKKLIDLGFQHVGEFRDGWEAWQNAGLPVEKSHD